MKKKNVKKLWQGLYVSVRDYELQNAVKVGGMKIEHQGKMMTLSKDNCETILLHGKKSALIKSKIGGRNYHMIDITWKPDVIDARQNSFFD